MEPANAPGQLQNAIICSGRKFFLPKLQFRRQISLIVSTLTKSYRQLTRFKKSEPAKQATDTCGQNVRCRNERLNDHFHHVVCVWLPLHNGPMEIPRPCPKRVSNVTEDAGGERLPIPFFIESHDSARQFPSKIRASHTSAWASHASAQSSQAQNSHSHPRGFITRRNTPSLPESRQIFH